MMRSLVLLFIHLIALGCTAESSPEKAGHEVSSGNHRPVIHEAAIVPVPLVLNAPIAVEIHADDQDRDALAFHYQWVVNGHPLAEYTASTLPVDVLKQGDMVSVEIVPDDGKERGAVYHTASVSVANTPPIISALIVRPSPAIPGDKLDVVVEVSDPDHDSIGLSYRWWKNNAVVKEGEDPILETRGFSPQDIVAVEVIPRDQASVGKLMKSAPLILGNSPPTIVSLPPVSSPEDRYEYAVKAMDPEGDALRYRLEVAPPGMTIEMNTGRIIWQKTKGLKGMHKVRVVAEDSQGGTAFQEFEVILASPTFSSSDGA